MYVFKHSVVCQQRATQDNKQYSIKTDTSILESMECM